MRTKLLVAAAALLAAGALSSMAQSNVYSVNVVGYVNKTCNAGAGGAIGYTLIANPLDSKTNTLNGVLASYLPANYAVMKWGGTAFLTYSRTPTGWLPPTGGAATVEPGEGFFVRVPALSNAVTITFVGDVLQGWMTNNYTAAYTLTGNKFPDSGTLVSMNMTNVVTNDKIMLWGGAGYNTYTKTATGWLPPGSGPSIGVADGFFVNVTGTGGPFAWVRYAVVQ